MTKYLIERMSDFLFDYLDDLREHIVCFKECNTLPFEHDLATMSKQDRVIYDEMVAKAAEVDAILSEYIRFKEEY